MIDIKKITYRPTLHIILFIVRGALVSLLIHTWYLSHAVQVSNFSAWCQQIKNEHVFGDRNPTLACFSVTNFKLKMVLVSTKWQISCMVIDLRLLPTNNPSWPDPQLFPFFNLSVICILASFHYKSCAQMLMILKSSSTTQMALLHPFPF